MALKRPKCPNLAMECRTEGTSVVNNFSFEKGLTFERRN